MKRILLCILVLILAFTCVNITVFAASEKTPTISFDSAKAEKGETVTLELNLENNPGIAAMLISLKYDETALTLTGTKKGTLFSGFTAGKNFAWDDSKNITKNGVMATFTFAVSDTAEPGEYGIEIIIRQCINEDYDDIACTVQNGKIVVKGEPKPVETSGSCGDNLTWSLDLKTGLLTISGSGAMYDYENTDVPWGTEITEVVLPKGITSIGKSAFEDCSAITKVYYQGLKSDWDEIKIEKGNTHLANASISFTCTDHDYKWVVDKNETCGENGTKHEECSLCRAKRNENTKIPATENHTYDNTCDENCNICGYIRTVTHSYADSWTSDKDGHWHACSVCGAKDEVIPHTAGDAATEDTPQLCTVCGHEITSAKTHEHEYEGDYIGDADGHYKNCNCGKAGEKVAHTFDSGVVVKEPTEDEAGEKHYTCETCGYVKKSAFNLDDEDVSEVTPDDDAENSIFTTTFIVVVFVLGAVVISVIVFFIINKKV